MQNTQKKIINYNHVNCTIWGSIFYQSTCTIDRQQNKCYSKGVYLSISKLHSILAVANLLAHNNKSQICYCGQISLQSATVNCSFSDNLTPLGVPFILLAMAKQVRAQIIWSGYIWHASAFQGVVFLMEDSTYLFRKKYSIISNFTYFSRYAFWVPDE